MSKLSVSEKLALFRKVEGADTGVHAAWDAMEFSLLLGDVRRLEQALEEARAELSAVKNELALTVKHRNEAERKAEMLAAERDALRVALESVQRINAELAVEGKVRHLILDRVSAERDAAKRDAMECDAARAKYARDVEATQVLLEDVRVAARLAALRECLSVITALEFRTDMEDAIQALIDAEQAEGSKP